MASRQEAGDLQITSRTDIGRIYNAHADALSGYAEPDTSETLTINRSPEKILLCVLGFLVFAAMCFHLAILEGTDIWYGASALLGLMACLSAGLAFERDKSRITLTPEGFHSENFTPNFIPWTSVEKISCGRIGGYKFIILRIADQIWSSASSRDRSLRGMNRAIRIDGLPISNALLDIRFNRLEELFTAYARAHGGKVD